MAEPENVQNVQKSEEPAKTNPPENPKPTNTPPDDPYNKVEFEEFIKSIGDVGLEHWNSYAIALGVSIKTIKRWRQHPLAKQALARAIQDNLREMRNAGINDWRMYRDKLKMLGVEDSTTVKVEGDTSDKAIAAIQDIVKSENERTKSMVEFAKQQSLANAKPVQNQGQVGPDSNVPAK